MTKTIEIKEGCSLTLSNKTAWALYYRDQFNIDIVPTLMPILAATFTMVSDIAAIADKKGNLEFDDTVGLLNSDSTTEALIKLSGIEFIDLINITWALAKAADPSIEEPRKWILEFEEFPLDIIMPAVVELIFKGLVSTKKAMWLQEKLNKIKVSLQPKLEKMIKQ